MSEKNPLPVGGDARGRRFNGDGARASVRVLIVHGQSLVRAGYRVLLESDEQIVVVAEATTGRQGADLAATAHPDVALLDLSMAELDDPAAIARIVSDGAFAGVAVLLMVPSERHTSAFSALLAGAVGIVQKDTGPTELIWAVRLLARGEALVPAAAVRRLIGEMRERPHPEQLEDLTDREREVVALVAKGLSNGEIASLLVVSPKTIKTHVSRAMVKLGARHRAQLVVLAYETGLAVAGRGNSELSHDVA